MRSFARQILAVLIIVSSSTVAMAQVQWQTDLEAAKRTAAQTNKLVLMHFWASWCKPCMRLEKTVFNQPGIGESLAKDYVPVKVNVDVRPTTARQYGVESIPADVIITPDGKVIAKTSSPRSPAAYIGRMQQVAMKVPNRGLQAYAGLNTTPAATTPAAPVANPAIPQTAPPATATPATATPATATPATTAPLGAYGTLPAQTATAPLGQQLAPNTAPTQPFGQPQAQAPATQPAAAFGQPAAANQNKYSDYPGNAALPGGPSAFGAPLAQQPPQQQQATTPPAFQQPSPPITSQQPIMNHVAQPPQTPRTTITPRQTPPQAAAAEPTWGMDAFCPVTLNSQKQWVPGDRRWGVEHQGVVYLFASDAAKQKFLANPAYYAPVLAGHDPVEMIDRRNMVQGRREHGVFYRDRVYMFSGEASLQAFSSNPARYAAQIAALEAHAAGR